MINEKDNPNHLYERDDQRRIASDPAKAKKFTDLIRSFAATLKEASKGEPSGLALVYDGAKPYLRDSGIIRHGKTPSKSDFINTRLKQVRPDGSYKIVAPLLAWLCDNHPVWAAKLYDDLGLAEGVEGDFREYVGEPGVWADDTEPIPASVQARVGRQLRGFGEALESGFAAQSEMHDTIKGVDQKLDDGFRLHERSDETLKKVDRTVTEIAKNQAAQRHPNRERTNIERAWDITKRELTISPYEKFAEKYPDHPLGSRAKSHIDDLIVWERISQDDPFAIRDFIQTGPYEALAEHARDKLDLVKETYAKDRAKTVFKRMRTGRSAHPAATAIVACAAAFFGIFFWVSVVALGKWSYETSASDIKLIADISQTIEIFWNESAAPWLAYYLSDADISVATLPVGVAVAQWILTICIFALIAVTILTIIYRVGDGIDKIVAQNHEKKMAVIEAHHMSKVVDI